MKKQRCRGGCGVIMLVPDNVDPICGQCKRAEEAMDDG